MWVYNVILIIVGVILLIKRYYDFQRFYKSLIKSCQFHDELCAHTDQEKTNIMLNDPKYYLTEEWSAIKFVFFNGPNPVLIFLSFKKLDIYNIYNNEVIKKMYDNIERKLQ